MDWSTLRERVLTLPALEQKREHLGEQQQVAEIELKTARRLHERGQQSVDKMQSESLSAFLFRLIGRYEDRLEKVQQDEIHAKVEYDRAVKHLDFLQTEINSLETRLADIRKDETLYKAELNKRRRGLSDNQAYTEIESKIAEIISQQTEIREAQTVTTRAQNVAASALESLESAESWATFDLFSNGGLITHMAKYSHIDDAEETLHELSSLLRDLQVELGDVHGMDVGDLSGIQGICSAQRGIDLWFDNIFTDWSVKQKVADNADEVQGLIENLAQIQAALTGRLGELGKKLKEVKRREEDFLMNTIN